MMPKMGDFFEFLKALFRHWLAVVVSVAIAVISIKAVERTNDVIVEPALYGAVGAGLAFVVASFLAFVDERRRRLGTIGSDGHEGSSSDQPPTVGDDDIEALVAQIGNVETATGTPGLESTEAISAAEIAGPITVADAAGRPFLQVTPKFLLDLGSDQSPADAVQATAPYIGKWLGVTLILTQVQDYPPGNCIFVNGKSSDSSNDSPLSQSSSQDVACTFDRKVWLPHLQSRITGDAIRVIGEVANVGNDGLRLIRCEMPKTSTAG